jgi:hypothetical protein
MCVEGSFVDDGIEPLPGSDRLHDLFLFHADYDHVSVFPEVTGIRLCRLSARTSDAVRAIDLFAAGVITWLTGNTTRPPLVSPHF